MLGVVLNCVFWGINASNSYLKKKFSWVFVEPTCVVMSVLLHVFTLHWLHFDFKAWNIKISQILNFLRLFILKPCFPFCNPSFYTLNLSMFILTSVMLCATHWIVVRHSCRHWCASEAKNTHTRVCVHECAVCWCTLIRHMFLKETNPTAMFGDLLQHS
jgi:putative effector of murein hydrolase